MADRAIPSLFEWAGGMPAFERLTSIQPMPQWGWGEAKGPYIP